MSWESVHARLTGDSGYSLLCDYRGPEGEYNFRYIVQGKRILTEVLEGSTRGAGTRVYYNPDKDRENVTMQTRMFRLRRSLQARDIKDTPLYRPLFAHLLEEISEPKPREARPAESGGTVFLFGDEQELHEFLEVDPSGNPLRLRRLMKGKELNVLTFRQLQWGNREIDWKD